MKKILTILLCLMIIPCLSESGLQREKGQTVDETIIFRRNVTTEFNDIPIESNLLLDFTSRNGNVYTAPQGRSASDSFGTELSDVDGFYNGWFLNWCGEIRIVIDYTSSKDDEDVVIGRFTLESAFDEEPTPGSHMRLVDPEAIEDFEQGVIKVDTESQVQLGGDNDIALIFGGTDVFGGDNGANKYEITDEDQQFFVDLFKPVKTNSVNVSVICTPFGSFAAFHDIWLEQIGIFLDSVPAGTRMRWFLEGDDTLNSRYPLLENVTLDEFRQGSGTPVSVSDINDISTWNVTDARVPAISRIFSVFILTFQFSDGNGDPVFLDIPIDTSVTDSMFFDNVRLNNIQSASGTSITLDTGADPADDSYNGMRLYDDNGEFRNIIDYNGTTKVATIESAFTITPSASDPYEIKIAFIRPLMTFEGKVTIKSRIQDKHNRRELSFANDGEDIEIGTVTRVDTTAGAPTFTVPPQRSRSFGAFIKIIDKEGTFDINPVTLDFAEFDFLEGVFNADLVLNKKDVISVIRYTDDDSFGWTVDTFNVKRFGEMFQFDTVNNVGITMANSWFPINGYSEGETENITFQNGNELKITEDGKYKVDYGICWTGGVNALYKFELAVNDIPIGKTQACGRIGTANDIVNSSMPAILDLVVGDIVTLKVLNNTNSSDITVASSNVSLTKIRD